MMGWGLIGLRFGPLESTNTPVSPSGSYDYSDLWKYWTNTSIATVTVKGIWNADSEEFETEEYENVVVKRIFRDVNNPEFQISLRTDEAGWLVPIALIGGNAMKDGDRIEVSGVGWTVQGDCSLRISGDSPSHFVCRTVKER